MELMEHQELPQIPNNIEGVSIHISYMRIAIQEINKKLDNISNSFVSQADFAKHLEADEDHEARIRVIEEFKDTLVGKMWGIGVLTAATVGGLTILANHFWR